MQKKIAFIGAGSLVFTRNIVRDILSFPAFHDCTIALMDINETSLLRVKAAVDKIVEHGKYPAQIIATTDRIEALKDADGVITTILTGGYDQIYYDIAIPKKYGISINVGDTRGPSGIFRFLRTIPVMLDICKDIGRYCPNAVFLNYTNPMAMLCSAMQKTTKVTVTGLCHSVQSTAAKLAKWIGAPENEIAYFCAGINHQAWYLEFKWNGQDAYPLIREAVKKPEIYNEEQVRNEMLFHLGYYVTESSGHNSEYNPWFRKRPDLIEKYCMHGTGWNPGLPISLEKLNNKAAAESRDKAFKEWMEKPIDDHKSIEYAANIFNAVFGDMMPFEFHGNVQNFNLIENLPYGACVEVPVLASKRGLSPMHIGRLPEQLALLNSINAQCEELAVEAALTGDPQKVYHAVYYDPLTSAVLSLGEIKSMVDEMFEANKDWITYFKHRT